MTGAPFDFTALMVQARQVAEQALPGDVPVGALLLDPSGRCVAQGWNRREIDSDCSAHAEIVALREAGKQLGQWRFEGYTMVVTLEPCPMCASALMQCRIGTIVFGAWDPIQGALGSALSMQTLYPWEVEIIGGIDEPACRTQLQAFFQGHRAS